MAIRPERAGRERVAIRRERAARERLPLQARDRFPIDKLAVDFAPIDKKLVDPA